MTRFLTVFVLFIGLTVPAEAQSRRELAARIDQLEARLAQIEQQALAGDPVANILQQRIDALEADQRTLTSEIERLGFENRNLRRELENLGYTVNQVASARYSEDLDEDGQPVMAEAGAQVGEVMSADRARAISQADSVEEARQAATGQLTLPGPSTGGRAAERDGPARLTEPARSQTMDRSVPSPDVLFRDGRSRLLDGDYAGAQERFATFTQTYSDDALTGQAWYWLGETHFVQGDFQDAADAYLSSLRTDRQGEQAPDALVRLAASLAALDQVSEACGVLASFDSEFPNADDDARRKAEREAVRAGCS